jgi:hypothetical protein
MPKFFVFVLNQLYLISYNIDRTPMGHDRTFLFPKPAGRQLPHPPLLPVVPEVIPRAAVLPLVFNSLSFFLLLPLVVLHPPPPNRRIITAIPIRNFPRLRRENIVDIFHLVVPPYWSVAPPQRLQRIVLVAQRHPLAVERIAQQGLIRKGVASRLGWILNCCDDLVVHLYRWLSDQQAAIANPQAEIAVRASLGRSVGVAVLWRVPAVLRNPDIFAQPLSVRPVFSAGNGKGIFTNREGNGVS